MPHQKKGQNYSERMRSTLGQLIHNSPFHALLILVGLLFVGGSLASLVGFVAIHLFLGLPVLTQPDLLQDLSNPAVAPALRLLQTLSGLGMLVVPPLVWLKLKGDEPIVPKLPWRQPLLISIALMPVALPLVNRLATLNGAMELPWPALQAWLETREQSAAHYTELFLQMDNVGLLALNLIMIALLPALGEELIFRRIVQPMILQRTGHQHLAVWLTAAVFSAIHFQFFGFVPRMILGAGLGYLYLYSGNIVYPIIAHFMNNGLAVMMAYFEQRGWGRENMSQMGANNNLEALFSLALLLMLLYLFAQWHRVHKAKA